MRKSSERTRSIVFYIVVLCLIAVAIFFAWQSYQSTTVLSTSASEAGLSYSDSVNALGPL